MFTPLDLASLNLKYCLKKESLINLDYFTTTGVNELLYPYAKTPDMLFLFLFWTTKKRVMTCTTKTNDI